MKKLFFKLCLLACITLLGVACSNSSKLTDNEFIIEGKVSGLEDGAVISLFKFDDSVGNLITTDTLRNGRFAFREKVESNQEMWGVLHRSNGRMITVWAAPQTVI